MIPMASMLRLAMLLGVVALASGCASQPPMVSDPTFAAVLEPEPKMIEPKRNGAIFNPEMHAGLFGDQKAFQVGDVLTVKLQEKTDASKSAKATSTKADANEVGVASLFGLPANTIGNMDATLSASRSFSGDGTATQKNKLEGDITVTVARVMPNGNLMIQGEKFIGINQGLEFVRIAGVVRPADVARDNTVLSTRVANARIQYGGEGAINDANTQGWLGRFFSSPFFPL
ncbi:MAG: flagellar basal body L-ring protein FlgH [Pseudomonadota bacterium]